MRVTNSLELSLIAVDGIAFTAFRFHKLPKLILKKNMSIYTRDRKYRGFVRWISILLDVIAKGTAVYFDTVNIFMVQNLQTNYCPFS